jgi:hypothetical protein
VKVIVIISDFFVCYWAWCCWWHFLLIHSNNPARDRCFTWVMHWIYHHNQTSLLQVIKCSSLYHYYRYIKSTPWSSQVTTHSWRTVSQDSLSESTTLILRDISEEFRLPSSRVFMCVLVCTCVCVCVCVCVRERERERDREITDPHLKTRQILSA